MIIGKDGPAVVLDARACAWLERYAGLTPLRGRIRGTDPHISAALLEVREAAMSWFGSVSGCDTATTVAEKPQPAARSKRWLSVTEAADLVGISSSAIGRAIREDRLPAHRVGGRWQVDREDAAHYKAARAART